MRKVILLMGIAMFSAVQLFAQESTKNAKNQTDTIRIFNMIIIHHEDSAQNVTRVSRDTSAINQEWKKNVQTHWLVFDIGLNNYIDRTDYNSVEAANFAAYKTTPSGIEPDPSATNGAGPNQLSKNQFRLITGKSINVNIWAFMQKLNLVEHKLNLVYGLGIQMYNFRYSKNITYYPGDRTVVARDTLDFKKNKLFAEYLSIPVMFHYVSDPQNEAHAFKVSAGLSGGLLFKSRTKQVSHEMGIVKRNDSFNLNNLRLALEGDVGYGPVELYGTYSLSKLHDYGLQQYPFAIGFRIHGF